MDYVFSHKYTEPEIFSQVYLKLREKYLEKKPLLVSDKNSPYSVLDEKSVKVIWYEQKYERRRLITVDGTQLLVSNPGEWNLDAGPDFINARIQLGGKGIITGDVEIHRKYSDWRSHQHQKDKKYDNVILHVFLVNDRPEQNKNDFIFSYSEKQIPQLELGKFITDLNQCPLDSDNYPYVSCAGLGECSKQLSSTKFDYLSHLLKLAGDARMILKSGRYPKRASKSKIEQLMYEAISEALGYKENKFNMRLLAKALPLKTLYSLIGKTPAQKRVLLLQALFLGVSNLLPDTSNSQEKFDCETNSFLNRLTDIWQKYKPKLKNRIFKDTEKWNLWKVRPTNFPARRIAGLAYLVDRFFKQGLLDRIFSWKEKIGKDEFCSIFVVDEAKDYFSERANFGTKKFSKPLPSIGEDRALTMVVNVLIPFLLYWSRTKREPKKELLLHKFFSSFPNLIINSQTRLLIHRLVGPVQRLPIKAEQIQQGLLQIFADFCDIRAPQCSKCPLPAILELSPEELPNE